MCLCEVQNHCIYIITSLEESRGQGYHKRMELEPLDHTIPEAYPTARVPIIIRECIIRVKFYGESCRSKVTIT